LPSSLLRFIPVSGNLNAEFLKYYLSDITWVFFDITLGYLLLLRYLEKAVLSLVGYP